MCWQLKSPTGRPATPAPSAQLPGHTILLGPKKGLWWSACKNPWPRAVHPPERAALPASLKVLCAPPSPAPVHGHSRSAPESRLHLTPGLELVLPAPLRGLVSLPCPSPVHLTLRHATEPLFPSSSAAQARVIGWTGFKDLPMAFSDG